MGRLPDCPTATVKNDPWSIMFTNSDTGEVLVVDGRRGSAVRWQQARPEV